MFELVLANLLLVDVGLIDNLSYEEVVNKLFIETPNDTLLCELQWCFSDIEKSKNIFFNIYEEKKLDHDAFGNFLMNRLKDIYVLGDMDFQEFNSKVVKLWGILPRDLLQKEPFWSMSYAGEPLSWGDSLQSKQLYEKMFDYYS